MSSEQMAMKQKHIFNPSFIEGSVSFATDASDVRFCSGILQQLLLQLLLLTVGRTCSFCGPVFFP